MIGVAPDGTVVRLSQARRAAPRFEAATLARVDPPSGLTPDTARLLVADLDNNGAGDLVISSPAGITRSCSARGRRVSSRWRRSLPGGITSAADLDGDGRLELIGRAGDGARVRAGEGTEGRITGRRFDRAP